MNIVSIEVSNWKNAIHGMRSPKKSWDKSDSKIIDGKFHMGDADKVLFLDLAKAGSAHRKVLRQVRVSCIVEGSLKFFDQLSTYEFLTSNSTSQMHTLTKQGFTKENFVYIDDAILELINRKRLTYLLEKDKLVKKRLWDELLYSIPQSFIYERTLEFNYEVFLSMYRWRSDHKLDEWKTISKVLREALPYMNDLIERLSKQTYMYVYSEDYSKDCWAELCLNINVNPSATAIQLTISNTKILEKNGDHIYG